MHYIDKLWNALPPHERTMWQELKDRLPDTRSRHAVLDDENNVVPCDIVTSMLWTMRHNDRRTIMRTEIGEGVVTSFITIDLSGRLRGPQEHFETMDLATGWSRKTHDIAFAIHTHKSLVRAHESKVKVGSPNESRESVPDTA